MGGGEGAAGCDFILLRLTLEQTVGDKDTRACSGDNEDEGHGKAARSTTGESHES
jgi:hypothetical protein